MIVGNGSIAKAFKSNTLCHDDYTIFASGVSNSQETEVKQFQKELSLIKSVIEPGKKFVYFTSVLSSQQSNDYYKHKFDMERFIIQNSENYLIYRIPQVISTSGNKLNLVNFLVEHIVNRQPIIVYQEVKRSILDVEDLVSIVDYSKDKMNRGYVNISIEKIFVEKLIKLIAQILNQRAITKVIEGIGDFKNWSFENSDIVNEWMQINHISSKGYTAFILRKYL